MLALAIISRLETLQSTFEDRIDSSEFYYICDVNGHSRCSKRFPSIEKARKYYEKSHKKMAGVYIGLHSVQVKENIS